MIIEVFEYGLKRLAKKLRELNLNKPQITVKEGDLDDDKTKLYIYDDDDNKVGIILESQIEIHKEADGQLELYNTMDFQKTIFVTDEFI